MPLAALLAAATFAGAASALPQARLQVGTHAFQVEVAANPLERQHGLMDRESLEDGTGMLFVFEKKARHCFWMKRTTIPLSVAFLGDDGTILGIEDMQPQTLDYHCSREAVRYALEVKQGGFHSIGIRPGMQVTGGLFGPCMAAPRKRSPSPAFPD